MGSAMSDNVVCQTAIVDGSPGAAAVSNLGRHVQGFADALERAGREYLTRRGVTPSECHRLTVEYYPTPGLGCARVCYGALYDHVAWMRVDPAYLAATMLQTMLPPIGT
jgi:hypothetical protein